MNGAGRPRLLPFAAHALASVLCGLSLGGCDDGNSGGDPDGGAVPDAALDSCLVGERQLVIRDRDLDGFGDQAEARPVSCVERGWVAYPEDFVFDCDDRDSEAHPGVPLRCDFDGDGVVGALDCDDRNGRRYPGAVERCNGFDDDCDTLVDDADQVGLHFAGNNYVLDEDGDRYPSLAVFACTPPGGAYLQWDETPPLARDPRAPGTPPPPRPPPPPPPPPWGPPPLPWILPCWCSWRTRHRWSRPRTWTCARAPIASASWSRGPTRHRRPTCGCADMGPAPRRHPRCGGRRPEPAGLSAGELRERWRSRVGE
ncbi:MAG: hypothetical protein IPL19_16125 [Sandaracinaceae bacterium]|nr:hypothetical protein [Sandaracinaceae bacterium]